MNARQWANPDKLFDVFTTLSYSKIDSKDVKIESVIPSHYDTQDILNQIPKFAYPCKYDSPGVEVYTFVLTDVEAKFHYGFCRFSHDQQHIMCILSRLPWFDEFYSLLNKISEVSIGDGGEVQVQVLLEAVYNTKVPLPNQQCVILDDDTLLRFSFEGPNTEQLARIPSNRNLSEYYSAIDYELMITVFACMLNERRILVTSKKLCKLTACCHAAASLLYPCYWQHLFIPVLPEAVIDFVTAPMPYIIGVHDSLMEKVKRMDLEDAVILSIDDGTLHSPHDDRSLLPSDSISSLKRSLKPAAGQGGDSIARAFLRCLVRVIGGYRDGLKYHEDTVAFDEDTYFSVANSSSERAWREVVVKMQYFSQFIDDRLALLNSGKGFEDEFEREMTRYDDRNSGVKYREWLSNMKKQGKKIKSKGQHTFFDIRKKVHVKSKQFYNDMKGKLDDKLKKDYSIIDRGNSHYVSRTDDQGNSSPQFISALPIRPSRPLRPASTRSTTAGMAALNPRLQGSPRRQSYNKALKYKTLSFTDDDVHLPSPGAFELLNDPDIQGVLMRKSHSAANIDDFRFETGSSTSTINSEKSTTSSPIPPPRRKRTEPLIPALSSVKDVTLGTESEGFGDDFNPRGDSNLLVPLSDPPSVREAIASDNLLLDTSSTDTAAHTNTVNTRSSINTTTHTNTVNARSSINDLLGLDLSPSQPNNPYSAATTTTTGHNTNNIWNQNQPNYNIYTTDHRHTVSQNQYPATMAHQPTNPFSLGYSQPSPTPRSSGPHKEVKMTTDSSLPSLAALSQANGHISAQKPGRPPPIKPLTPISSQANPAKPRDPIADINWKW